MLKANASVVFHLAATIRFNEKLKVAAQINIKGTAEIIEICKILDTLKVIKGIDNLNSDFIFISLQAFVHVSTAYANCVRGEVDEKIYLSATQVDNLRKLTDDVHANLSPDEEKSQ